MGLWPGRIKPISPARLSDAVPWIRYRASQGRNSGLFKAGMKWCGLPRNWTNLGAVYPYLTALNGGLAIPLPLREVEGIAKSIVNISSHNLASGQTQARFSQIQAAKGHKGGLISGAKRYQGSNEEAEPWKVEGVSRTTWYDRQAKPAASRASRRLRVGRRRGWRGRLGMTARQNRRVKASRSRSRGKS